MELLDLTSDLLFPPYVEAASLTERRTKDEIDHYIAAMKEVLS